jgi:hypothetical protein
MKILNEKKCKIFGREKTDITFLGEITCHKIFGRKKQT